MKVTAFGEGLLPDLQTDGCLPGVSSYGGEGRKQLFQDSSMGTNATHEGTTPMTSPDPNYLSKAPPSNTCTLEGRVSTYEWEGRTRTRTLQSMTGAHNQ